MSPVARRGVLLAAVAVSATLTFGAARVATRRYARAFAERSAVTIAGYLALVAPASKDRADYDLPLLLVRARALETLPGWTPLVEVYHATAPLVHATAPPLAPAELSRLRREQATGWQSARAALVAPLFDPDQWDVVGAVAVQAPRLTPVWLDWWLLASVIVTVGLGARAARAVGARSGAAPRALSWYAGAALLLGFTAYADVRVAARQTTDRWLTDTRMLVQEADASPDRPGLADVARAARGGELVVADTGPAAPQRGRREGVFLATVAIRLGPTRWLELRAPAADAASGGWLLGTLGLTLLGPGAAWLGLWIGAAARRPRVARETIAAWGFLTPGLCHLAVFSIVPLLLVPYVSIHRWSPLELGPAFAAATNFTRLATDPRVWGSIRTTLLYALYLPVTMALALAGAVALPRRSWSGRAARALLLLPYASSVVATALVWEWLYDPTLGPINRLLAALRGRPVAWLDTPATALVAVMIVSLVAQLGYQLTVFQAGLASIPSTYGDAARVDGAGGWRRFWKVTFPLLRPVTLFVFVTGLVGASQVFTYIYLLTQGGPLHGTDTLAYRTYQTGWRFLDLGYAGVIALVLAVLLLPIMRLQVRWLREPVEHA